MISYPENIGKSNFSLSKDHKCPQSKLWFGELLTCLTLSPKKIEASLSNFNYATGFQELCTNIVTPKKWRVILEISIFNMPDPNVRNKRQPMFDPRCLPMIDKKCFPCFTQFWKVLRNTSDHTKGFQKRYFINQELWSIGGQFSTRNLGISRNIPFRLWNRALINLRQSIWPINVTHEEETHVHKQEPK